MPTFYNLRENGIDYDFEDIFVPVDLFREGTLWLWGYNNFGRLGNGNTLDRSTPVTTFAGGNNWKQVSSSGGNGHTAAIKTDGTLWVWGYNNAGQLGISNTIYRSTPVTTFAGGNNWKQVSCGGSNTGAIKTDGTLWVWGLGINGELGTGQTTNKSTPVTTFAGGTNWNQVSVAACTAAIKTDGTLWVWGNNSLSTLGINSTVYKYTPVTTFAGGNNWKQVACGNAHTAAIKTDGTLWIWGYNAFGQLGNAQVTAASTPVTTFAGGNNWKQVSAGGQLHMAATKTDGTLWVWGYNFGSQLGNATTTNVSTPVTTFAGGTNWKQVSSGDNNIAAIKTDGTLWTWGSGGEGRLGNNNSSTVSTPVTTFAGGTNWKQVYCARHTAGIRYYDANL